MRTIDKLDEVAELAAGQPALFVRVSRGPEDDQRTGSTDYETGLTMPGLSVNPLHPARWWRDRPVADWVARQLCAYDHLVDDERRPWLLVGRIVDRGPDNEPLVEVVSPVAWLGAGVMDEAGRRRRESGSGSSRPEDGSPRGKPPRQS